MLLSYAELRYSADAAYNTAYGDIYYNPENGIAESEHVFIRGNRLPERFAACRDRFTIGEIGFGTGLNFLCTADTFLRLAPATARLHYLSFELHPIAPETLAVLHTRTPQPALSRALLRDYPGNHPGHHLLKLHPRIQLHLILGDIRQTLPALCARADAWYLDGFAPGKNPVCWSNELMRDIALHSTPHASAATFSAARQVRDALSQAGFQVHKCPGYGRKRDMISAVLETPPEPEAHWSRQPGAAAGTIAVIGAGIAGVTTARALAESGREVILCRDPNITAASSVPLAAPYLQPESGDTPERAYQLATWHHAIRALHRLHRENPALYQPIGLESLPGNARELKRHRSLLAQTPLNPQELYGDADMHLHYPRAGSICLPELLEHLKQHPGITCIDRHIGAYSDLPADCAAYILCTGWKTDLNPEPLLRRAIRPLRGQGTTFTLSQLPERIICAGRTFIPAPDGQTLHCGSAYAPNDSNLTPRAQDDADNRAALDAYFGANNARQQGHFVGIRAAVRDYMPLVGAIADSRSVAAEYAGYRRNARAVIRRDITCHARLYQNQGLGSKGCIQAWLNADVLCAVINQTPIPVPQAQFERLTPARFMLRALKRGEMPY